MGTPMKLAMGMVVLGAILAVATQAQAGGVVYWSTGGVAATVVVHPSVTPRETRAFTQGYRAGYRDGYNDAAATYAPVVYRPTYYAPAYTPCYSTPRVRTCYYPVRSYGITIRW